MSGCLTRKTSVPCATLPPCELLPGFQLTHHPFLQFNVHRNRWSLTLRCDWGMSNAYFVVAKDTDSSTPDRVIGVAMWLPPASPSAPESWTTIYHNWLLWFRQGLLNIWYLGHGGLNTKRYYIWKQEQAKIQKELWTDERGYWFCNIVTVLPEAQGKGVGKLLFEDVTKRADQEGTRCYLESSREEPNVKIYEKLGFELKGKMKVEDEGEVCDVSA